MQRLLMWLGRSAGLIGLLVTVGAILSRVFGAYYVGRFQVGTILQVGMAGMLAGCLAYLAAIAEASSDS